MRLWCALGKARRMRVHTKSGFVRMSGALKEFSIGSPCPYQRLTINVLNDLLPLVGLSTSRMWVGLRQSLSSMKTVAGLYSIFLFLKRDGMLSAGPGRYGSAVPITSKARPDGCPPHHAEHATDLVLGRQQSWYLAVLFCRQELDQACVGGGKQRCAQR